MNSFDSSYRTATKLANFFSLIDKLAFYYTCFVTHSKLWKDFKVVAFIIFSVRFAFVTIWSSFPYSFYILNLNTLFLKITKSIKWKNSVYLGKNVVFENLIRLQYFLKLKNRLPHWATHALSNDLGKNNGKTILKI